jgi:hypothetical protein
VVGVLRALVVVHPELRRVMLRSEGRTHAHDGERADRDECRNEFSRCLPLFQTSTAWYPETMPTSSTIEPYAPLVTASFGGNAPFGWRPGLSILFA